MWNKNRHKNDNPNSISLGIYQFNKVSMELSLQNKQLELSSKEAELLNLLLSSANSTVEREHMLKTVWGDEGNYIGRTLDVFISKLRKKLEGDANIKIVNIRGIGYKLVVKS
jgi:DNA-binding response OmpR family regulator